MNEQHEPKVDRRNVLLGAGKAAAAGVVATLGAGTATTAQAEGTVGQECMKHMPLIMKLYGKSIARFELRRGQPGADGAAPPFVATITIWIADPKAFDAAAAIHQAGLRADVSKFTNSNLTAQRDKIVGTAT
jgi:uncharacterized protein (TIGR02118 family)